MDFIFIEDMRAMAWVGIFEREKAALGIFLTLEEPTQPMQVEAVQAGYYHSPGWNQAYPRLQIATIQQLLDGVTLKLPPSSITFKSSSGVCPLVAVATISKVDASCDDACQAETSFAIWSS